MSPLAIVQEMYEAFGRGDVAAILSRLSPNVEWEYGGSPASVPWLQPRRGREEAQQFFVDLQASVEIQHFAPKEFFEGTRVVVVLLDLEARVKATGKAIREEDEVHIWRFNDSGQVTRFRHRADTHQHVEANRA